MIIYSTLFTSKTESTAYAMSKQIKYIQETKKSS